MYVPGSDEFDKGTTYRTFFAKINWEQNNCDKILRSIANDEMRAFFLSVEKQCLIAPYDGGMDFVLENETTKDVYKSKYKDWLSLYPEGL